MHDTVSVTGSIEGDVELDHYFVAEIAIVVNNAVGDDEGMNGKGG